MTHAQNRDIFPFTIADIVPEAVEESADVLEALKASV